MGIKSCACQLGDRMNIACFDGDENIWEQDGEERYFVTTYIWVLTKKGNGLVLSNGLCYPNSKPNI